MSTTHYEFPTINGTDAINGVDAINGLANAVDTALYAVDSTVSGQATDIQTALDNAASASTAANAASTNAAAAQATAGAAVNSATSAVNTAASTANALITFEQKFNLVSNSVSSGLAMSGWTYNLTLAQSSDGSIFKFYGICDSNINASKTMTRVGIPGGSGNYAYGVATGLTLNNAPSSAYVVSPAGFYSAATSTEVYDNVFVSFAVGTDGQIYIMPSSASAASWSNSRSYHVGYFPCLYFNASFGDDPINPDEG